MFSLDKPQLEKLTTWLNEKEHALGEEQLKGEHAMWVQRHDDGHLMPYLGAIGGGLTYEFTPTSLGDVVKVTWCKGTSHEATIDLSDYDSW